MLHYMNRNFNEVNYHTMLVYYYIGNTDIKKVINVKIFCIHII